MGTLAQQLKQEGLQKGLEQGREEGIHLNAIAIAKKLIAQADQFNIFKT